MTLPSARRAVVEPLEPRTFFAATLFADLSPADLNPEQFKPFGLRAAFAGKTTAGLSALWLTDATSAGTRYVGEFNSGSVKTLRQAGKHFFFTADGGLTRGAGLWRTDGKGRGTIFLTEAKPGVSIDTSEELHDDVGGKLIFIDQGGPIDRSPLWISDGTPQGTRRPVPSFRPTVSITQIIASGSIAYLFTGGNSSQSIWRFDATDDSLTQVVNARRIGTGVAIGKTLFFSAQDDLGDPLTLFRLNADTNVVRSLGDFAGLSVPTDMAGTLWFLASPMGGTTPQLYRLDGDGPRAVTSFTGDAFDGAGYVVDRAGIYFSASGTELWYASIRDAAARKVATLPDVSTRNKTRPTIADIDIAADSIYIAVGDGSLTELWRKPTVTVEAPPQSLGRIDAKEVEVVGGTSPVFVQYDASFTKQLMGISSVGTVQQLTDLRGGERGSYPQHLTAFKGGMFFVADIDVPIIADRQTFAAYFTDGNAPPVRLMEASRIEKAIGERRTNVLASGDIVYFSFRTSTLTGTLETQVWKSDGTEQGTSLLRGGLANVQFLAAGGGKLYFVEEKPGNVAVLWLSDGTGPGTKAVHTFTDYASTTDHLFKSAVIWQSRLYVAYGKRLWRSDGTDAGTVDETARLQNTAGHTIKVMTLSLRGDRLIIGADYDLISGIWETGSPTSSSIGLVLLLPQQPAMLKIIPAKNGKDLWVRTAVWFDKVDVPAKKVIASTNTIRSSHYFAAEYQGKAVMLQPDFDFLGRREGTNMYFTDGTTAGTVQVSDVPDPRAAVIGGDGALYTSGAGIYRTVGVTSKSISTGQGPDDILAVGDRIFFTSAAPDDVTGHDVELWSYRREQSVFGYLWEDADGDGVREVGEKPITGWRVFIDKNGDGVRNSNELFVRANSVGRYVFEDLPDGVYRIGVLGNDPFIPTTPISYVVTVQSGTSARRHFGFKQA